MDHYWDIYFTDNSPVTAWFKGVYYGNPMDGNSHPTIDEYDEALLASIDAMDNMLERIRELEEQVESMEALRYLDHKYEMGGGNCHCDTCVTFRKKRLP